MTRQSLLAANVISFSYATVALAHPGHGEPGDDFSVAHYVTEPVHLGVGFCLLAGAIMLIGLVWASHSRRRRHRPVC